MAVVVAANHYHLDPVKTVKDGNLARYMALRLLMREFPEQSKVSLARMVGYSPKSAQVMGSASQQPPRFNIHMFNQLSKIYALRLQESIAANATQPQLAHVEIEEEPEVPVKEATLPPPKEEDHDHTLEAFLHRPEPVLPKLEGAVQLPARASSDPRRRALEEKLREAVLNTGGKLVES